MTALMLAASVGDMGMVQILLDAGADPELQEEVHRRGVMSQCSARPPPPYVAPLPSIPLLSPRYLPSYLSPATFSLSKRSGPKPYVTNV